MIEFVYGSKGSGKTKKMIDMANTALETCEGDIIFLNDRDKYRVKVDTKIRFTNLEEFGIVGSDQLLGFISHQKTFAKLSKKSNRLTKNTI